MEEDSAKIWFEGQLRKILIGLYDPGILSKPPLPQLFNLAQRHDMASGLRRILTNAIEALRPTAKTPQDSQTWRVYQILRRRYTEQLTQQQVACNLGLSVRQLQRNEKQARQILTDYLWTTYNLAEPVRQIMQAHPDAGSEDNHPPSMAQELEWLQDTVPSQSVSLVSVLNEITNVLTPLMQNQGITTLITLENNMPQVNVKPPLLRQALLNILNTAIQCGSRNSQVEITAVTEESRINIRIKAIVTQCADPLPEDMAESMNMAQKLCELCHGSLRLINAPESGNTVKDNNFEVALTLPYQESIDVLVVDDNADVLQLYQRYLTGSRYRFRGTQNPQQGFELAVEMQPGVVMLDVMMPERDGWTLLGQLREHPETQHIPVIVCSILSQEQFAVALGAADFIRKPVNRQMFLEVLDRQLALPRTESG